MTMLYKLWHLVSAYLSIALMGVLAMATYSLVRNAPSLQTAGNAAPTKVQSDYFVEKFSLKNFDATGRLVSIVYGDFAKHYEQRDVLDVTNISMEAFDKAGRRSTGQAEKGLVFANGDEVELIGRVKVARPATVDAQGKRVAAVEITGAHLYGYAHLERFVSDQPVRITRDKDQITAARLDYDHVNRVTLMSGRVKGVIHPKP